MSHQTDVANSITNIIWLRKQNEYNWLVVTFPSTYNCLHSDHTTVELGNCLCCDGWDKTNEGIEDNVRLFIIVSIGRLRYSIVLLSFANWMRPWQTNVLPSQITQVSIAYYVFGSRWHVVRWRDRWGTKAELSGSLGQLGKDAVRMSLATRHNVQHITECLLFVVVAIQFSLSLAQRLKRDILFDLPLFRRTRPLVCPFHVRWKP